METLRLTLSFKGLDTEDHLIDFYDVAQALIGFQRSLALTTHLIINDEVITQAPSLDGATIIALPPKEGSWEITAILLAIGGVGTGIYKTLTAPQNTVLGHLIHSAYDYIVSESLGFHVDYDKTLGQQYEEVKEKGDKTFPILKQSRFDSLIEKTEPALISLHRPIIKSETAEYAEIYTEHNHKQKKLTPSLTRSSYEHINYTEKGEKPEKIVGRISSFNLNTFNGRIFTHVDNRPVPFNISKEIRNKDTIIKITDSLSANAKERFEGDGDII